MANVRGNTLSTLSLSGKTTEVLGAYHLPFAGIDELGGEAVVYLLPTLGIDVLEL